MRPSSVGSGTTPTHLSRTSDRHWLILDIRISGEEHGWTVLNLLTLDPETRRIPVIVCSAAIQSLHQHQDLLGKYGICALPKPFDIDALLETVARMLTAE